MTMFWLIRHGQTEWNVAKRIQGNTDSPLTALGHEQCARLAKRLAAMPKPPSVLFSSDLGRTRQTTSYLEAALNLGATFDSRLREIHFGTWEGEFWDDLANREPVLARRWRSFDPDCQMPGGESRNQAFQRVQTALMQYALEHPDAHVGVVLHGGIIQILFRWFLGLPINTAVKWVPENTSVQVAEWTNGTWFPRTFGDVAHLTSDFVRT